MSEEQDMPPNEAPELMWEASAASTTESYDYEDDDETLESMDGDGDGELNEVLTGNDVNERATTPINQTTNQEEHFMSSGLTTLIQDINELNSFYHNENKNEIVESVIETNNGIRCWYLNRYHEFREIVVWIVLTSERFLLNEETAFAWGLGQDLAIRLVFGCQSWDDEAVLPKVLLCSTLLEFTRVFNNGLIPTPSLLLPFCVFFIRINVMKCNIL